MASTPRSRLCPHVSLPVPAVLISQHAAQSSTSAKSKAEWFIDVQDTARLHVAALIDADIVNERIFGFAQAYNWNDILAIIRKLRPDHKVPADLSDSSKDLSKPLPRVRAEEILKKHFGKGFTGLEESVKLNLEGL